MKMTNEKLLNIQKNKFHNILIIYNDDSFTNKINKHLSKKYNVYIANNGYEAIEKLKNIQKPDLIISNIEMPIIDGHVFLEELSKVENYYFIPFIFILTHSKDNKIIKNGIHGVIDYIVKPFKETELEIKIESLINKEYDQ